MIRGLTRSGQRLGVRAAIASFRALRPNLRPRDYCAMDKLRIVLADDHRLMRTAIRLALADVADIEVVGEAETGPAVAPLVRSVDPDLVLLDIGMPGMDGLAVLERLRERYPRVKVVMLSGVEESD